MPYGKTWTWDEVDARKYVDELKAVTVPVNISIEGKQRILCLAQVEKLLRKARKIAITDCECRSTVRGCDAVIIGWLAEAQRNCPIPIRVVACPMYPLTVRERNIQPRHFSANLLRRIPYWERGCAAGMPRGYITILPNGDVIPCMLLQVKLGNVREQDVREIWQNSPILSKIRARELLQGKCRECQYKAQCGGCRGRAYEESGNIMAGDPGCWMR